MKIAVIGSGISGLVSSYVLQRDHEVTLFEANSYLGGHTHTVDVELENEKYAVDTGFIVFNNKIINRTSHNYFVLFLFLTQKHKKGINVLTMFLRSLS